VSCAVDPTARANPVVGLQLAMVGNGVESGWQFCERKNWPGSSVCFGIPFDETCSSFWRRCGHTVDEGLAGLLGDAEALTKPGWRVGRSFRGCRDSEARLTDVRTLRGH
jgi:hypothetical protein